MHLTHHYKIDFEKVKSIEDVIRILKAIDPTFERPDDIKEIQDLVKVVEKPNGNMASVHIMD